MSRADCLLGFSHGLRSEKAIEAVVSRADLRAALTVVSETVPPPGAEDPDDWRVALWAATRR